MKKRAPCYLRGLATLLTLWSILFVYDGSAVFWSILILSSLSFLLSFHIISTLHHVLFLLHAIAIIPLYRSSPRPRITYLLCANTFGFSTFPPMFYWSFVELVISIGRVVLSVLPSTREPRSGTRVTSLGDLLVVTREFFY